MKKKPQKSRPNKERKERKTVRGASDFLASYGFTPEEIDPRQFLNASVKLKKSFFDILQQLRLYTLGGQSQGQSPVAAKAAGVESTEGM